MNTRRIVAAGVAIAASLSLAACGAKPYVPLTSKTEFAKVVSKASANLRSVRMVSKASALLTLEAVFSFRTPIAMQMVTSTTIDGKTSTSTVRVIGSTIYIQAARAGKWAKIASSKGQTATQVKNYGPAGFAAQFENGVRSIRYVGSTKIDGQIVQHYTLVMDASQLGSSFSALATRVPSFANLKTYNEQVYVSDQNVLRRISLTLPAPVGTEQTDFTQWNAPVSVNAPAASDIATSSGS